MRLHCLKIIGFRRISQADVYFGDATFLIGANNSGKSSILRAIEYLLSAKKRIPTDEYYSEIDTETLEQKPIADEIVIEAEFRNLPKDSEEWRGFRGRIFDYETNGDDDSGKSIHYRKTYPIVRDCKVEILSRKRNLRAEFENVATSKELIDKGVNAELVESIFGPNDVKLTAALRRQLGDINEVWELEDETEWFENPGGIPGVVLSRLPKFLLVPEESSAHEIDKNSGVLNKTLNELFNDVRDASENYKQAQIYLDALAQELDPADEGSDFGRLMGELNTVLAGVFPESSIHATADLTDPNSALKPNFDVKLASNILTSVSLQGTGMIRSAVFALLRFRQHWLARREQEEHRGLIIGFEEPEIYLHPSAANQMRNTIYDLSDGNSQIVATTHSPYLIDLSRRPRQVLNRFSPSTPGVDIRPFNVSDEYAKLEENDKTHIKMILKIDDYVARAFFTRTVLIVEGDTEDIVIREALRRLSITNNDSYLNVRRDFEIVKARGKASIISLVTYLKALGLDIVVMHDRDKGIEGAEKFNGPIAAAVNEASKVIVLEECLEHVLGYDPPASEKPFNAYSRTTAWPEEWLGVPQNFRHVLGRTFRGYIPSEGS